MFSTSNSPCAFLKATRGALTDIASRTDFNGTKLLNGSASSLSFQTGANGGETVTVELSRYAVTTHERSWKPCRSVTICGSAVATIVWSSAASSVASMTALKETRSCRRLIARSP